MQKEQKEQNQKIKFLKNKVNVMEQKEINTIMSKKESNLRFYYENGKVMKSFFKNNSEEVISDFIGLVSDYITKKISFQELDISQLLESLNFSKNIKSYL